MTRTFVEAGSLGNSEINYQKKFEELSKQVKSMGLMKPRVRLYVGWMVLNTVLLAGGWVAFFTLGNSWWSILAAPWLAFFYGQTGLIGHDIGHNQVFRKRRVIDVVGFMMGNTLIGVSQGWWVFHHNRHHSNPNHLELDPDIVRRQVIFSTTQVEKRQGIVNRFIIRHQSWLFFVIIFAEGFRLHAAGYIALTLGAIKRNRFADIFLLTAHLAVYLVALFWILDPFKAIVFILVHQGLFGLYMGLLFAPNHKGLPVRDGDPDSLDWARRQIITSRNLISNRFVDYIYDGLNYQIEHHLFPAMPSVNLRKVRPLVMDFCYRNELPYVEMSVSDSYKEVSKFLGEVSDQSQPLMHQ